MTIEQDLYDIVQIILYSIIVVVSFIFGFVSGKYNKHNKDGNKPTPKSHWNYRVATRLSKHPLREEKWREYLILNCYYTNGVLNSYGDTEVKMSAFEALNDLKRTNEFISHAFDKEIIDLDNFPNIYTEVEGVSDYVGSTGGTVD